MPAWLRRLRARLKYRRFDRDVAHELELHRELKRADLEREGASSDEARVGVSRALGNTTLAREDSRGVWLTPRVESAWHDVRYGARLLRRSPAFSLTAALVLALGIGANTALFSIVHGLFDRPLHVERPEELFYLAERNSSGQVFGAGNPAAFEFFEREIGNRASFTHHWPWDRARVSVDDETDRTTVEVVTSNYFDVLGVGMALGRPFRPEDDEVSNPERSVVISHEFWIRRLAGSAAVLGRQVRVQERFFRVIGVASAGFRGLSDPWHPVTAWVTRAQLDNRIGMGPVGRLARGTSFEEVQTLVAARTRAFREDYFSRFPNWLREREPNWVRQGSYPLFRVADVQVPTMPQTKLIPTNVLVAMFTVVALVLVIATTNIAGLLLARGVSRTGELAVRRALGAGRIRLVRQLLTETVLLAAVGAAIGIGVAAVMVHLVRLYTPPAFAVDVVLDVFVLLFALALAVGTGVLVGLVPAVQAMKVDVIQALGIGLVGARSVSGRLNRWVVASQVALSLVLLLVAAVHVRALMKIELSDLGYRTDGAIVFNVGRWEPDPPRAETPEEAKQQVLDEAEKVRQFNRNILARMDEVRGDPAFALATSLPLHDYTYERSVAVDRDTYLAGAPVRASATRAAVSDRYFSVMGMRLLKGRTFDDRDILWGTRVAVISESLGRSIWQGADPIGKSVGFVSEGGDGKIEWLLVVGVVNEVDPVIGATGDQPRVYVSLVQEWRAYAYNLIVRGSAEDAALVRDVKHAVAGADTFAEVTSVQALSQMVGELLYPRRAAAAILGAAGLVGLILATVGLYGIVSYSAAQRTRELGLRAALGARPSALVKLLLNEGARVAVIGTAAGAVLAFMALRLTARMYPDLPTLDLLSFALVPAALLVVILVACLLPARRAARVAPAVILRGE